MLTDSDKDMDVMLKPLSPSGRDVDNAFIVPPVWDKEAPLAFSVSGKLGGLTFCDPSVSEDGALPEFDNRETSGSELLLVPSFPPPTT